MWLLFRFVLRCFTFCMSPCLFLSVPVSIIVISVKSPPLFMHLPKTDKKQRWHTLIQSSINQFDCPKSFHKPNSGWVVGVPNEGTTGADTKLGVREWRWPGRWVNMAQVRDFSQFICASALTIRALSRLEAVSHSSCLGLRRPLTDAWVTHPLVSTWSLSCPEALLTNENGLGRL